MTTTPEWDAVVAIYADTAVAIPPKAPRPAYDRLVGPSKALADLTARPALARQVYDGLAQAMGPTAARAVTAELVHVLSVQVTRRVEEEAKRWRENDLTQAVRIAGEMLARAENEPECTAPEWTHPTGAGLREERFGGVSRLA